MLTYDAITCSNDKVSLSILLVLSAVLIGIYVAGSVGLVYYHLKG